MVSTLLTVTEWILPLLYLALVLDYGVTFFLRTRTEARGHWVLAVIGLHGGFLVFRGHQLGYPPLFSAYEVLSVVALATAAVYYVVEQVGKDRRTGVFVFGVIFLLQYTSSVFLTDAAASPPHRAISQPGWRSVHSVAATFAYTAMALAAVHGALHLIGRRGLKRRNFGVLFDRLPPLEHLGRVSWYSLVAGLIFMTVSVVTGALVFGQAGGSGSAGEMDLKVALKIAAGSATWLICAAAVLGKWFCKWSDSRMSLIATIGFAIIVALFAASMALS